MINLTHEKKIELLKRSVEVSKQARANGNTPFGAILADGEGNILLESENVELTTHKCTGHAETQLMEMASQKYNKEFLWDCILITTCEPCSMCSGAIYWGNVGNVIYGLEETELLRLTGDNEQNPTFNLPCRNIFDAGQKDIIVEGPFVEVAAEVAEVHQGFWG